MLNYVKSEWYRIARGRTMYMMAVIFAMLTVLMNFLLLICKHQLDNFPYAIVHFSFSALTSQLPFLFLAGILVVSLLFSDDQKNGILKNSIAYGISRESIFMGKCMISFTWALIVMVFVLIFYVGSAFLLLDGPIMEPLQKMLAGISVTLPSAFASIILATAVFSLCNNATVAIVWWAAITFIIPWIVHRLGLVVELFRYIATWLPTIFLTNEVTANMSQGYTCLWDTPFGLMKCMVAGFGLSIIYLVIGLVWFRKKEV